MPNLRAQNLHTFNQRLAIDAWSTGIIGLIMLFGKRPFTDLNVYETIPAIQILAESARLQLENVLDQISGECGDF